MTQTDTPRLTLDTVVYEGERYIRGGDLAGFVDGAKKAFPHHQLVIDMICGRILHETKTAETWRVFVHDAKRYVNPQDFLDYLKKFKEDHPQWSGIPSAIMYKLEKTGRRNESSQRTYGVIGDL
jgi:hypothetical protein